MVKAVRDQLARGGPDSGQSVRRIVGECGQRIAPIAIRFQSTQSMRFKFETHASVTTANSVMIARSRGLRCSDETIRR
jgi:hypothetical protein